MSETLRWTAKRISETPDEVLMFSFSLLMLVGVGLVVYWYYNRRRLHQLSHQIPAVVVKNYLDSIIQNSSALKSSLFRGGGLDIGEGIPSVVPVSELPSGSVSLHQGNGQEELNQKLAEIAKLTKRLVEKENLIKELEDKLRDASSNQSAPADQAPEIARLKSEVKRLQIELSEKGDSAPSAESGGNNEELEEQLRSVTTERDELKERLMEYEIIEEDLANLKRLQQENEQLRNQLASLSSGAPAPAAAKAPTPAPAPEPEPEIEPEPEMSEEPEAPAGDDSLEDEMARAIAESASEPEAAEAPEESSEEMEEEAVAAAEPEKKSSPTDQKSAEELLSEFEKMLG